MLSFLILLSAFHCAISFQKMKVYHGQHPEYLELEEVTQEKFRQFYEYSQAKVLYSFDYMFHENSPSQRIYFKTIEHKKNTVTRVQFCFLGEIKQEIILNELQDSDLVQFVQNKGYLFSSRIFNQIYHCIGINFCHNSDKEKRFRDSLMSFIDKEINHVKREREMVKQFIDFQKTGNSSFYVSQVIGCQNQTMNQIIKWHYDLEGTFNPYVMSQDKQLNQLEQYQGLNEKKKIVFKFYHNKEGGITRTQEIKDNNIFSAKVNKTISGRGLHRHAFLGIKISLKAIQNTTCRVNVVDYLDYDQYVDVEEIKVLSGVKHKLEKIIDIEKPSGVSRQHYLLLGISFDVQSQVDDDLERLEIDEHQNIHIDYPLHFRYRTPVDKQLYKRSYVNNLLKVFMSCEDNDDYNQFLEQKRFLTETGGKFAVELKQEDKKYQKEPEGELNLYESWQVIREQRGYLAVLTPVGQIQDNFFVAVFTLMITLSSAFGVSFVILSKKTEHSKSKKE